MTYSEEIRPTVEPKVRPIIKLTSSTVVKEVSSTSTAKESVLTKEEWLEWLFEYGEGELPDRLKLKRGKREVYYEILRVFGNWSQVIWDFERFIGDKKGTEKVAFLTEEKKEKVTEMAVERKIKREERMKSTGWGGRRRRYNEDDAREELYRLYNLLDGRMPTSGDVIRDGDMSWAVLKKYLGPREGWQKIIEDMKKERGAIEEKE